MKTIFVSDSIVVTVNQFKMQVANDVGKAIDVYPSEVPGLIEALEEAAHTIEYLRAPSRGQTLAEAKPIQFKQHD